MILLSNTKTILLEVTMMEALTKPTRAKVQYNLRVDPELMEWLKKAGKEYERPVNYVINQAIKNMRKEIEGAKA